MDINQIARYIISFTWIYHGLFPKLIWVAPIELEMTASMGFSQELSALITTGAGIGEILFGLVFFVFYKSIIINWLNIAALSGLLLFAAIFSPHILVEAFNPVTTTLPLIALAVVLIQNTRALSNNAQID